MKNDGNLYLWTIVSNNSSLKKHIIHYSFFTIHFSLNLLLFLLEKPLDFSSIGGPNFFFIGKKTTDDEIYL